MSTYRTNKFYELQKELLIAPLQLLASLLIVAGVFALMFEVKYFADFSVTIYLGRLIATFIGFLILFLTHYDIGKKHPIFLTHFLLITIILSFTSIILQVPESIYINSQLLSLLIFTSALFFSWDIKNQIIVAIYYNLLFALSILLNNQSIYFLPNFFAAFIFVIFISIISIVAASVNFKLRREALEKSLEAQNYLENAIEGIFKISEDGRIASLNPAAVRILGYESKDDLMQANNFANLFFNKDDYTKLIEELNKNGFIRDYEVEFKNSKAEKIVILLNARSNLFYSKSKHTIEGSFLDITERVNAREKIKEYNTELEKLNKSKDKFFSIVAHDLLSPFSSLLGFSEILNNESEELSREEIKEFSGDIHTVTAKAHSLLENLLSWSSIQANRTQFVPSEIDTHIIVEDIFVLYGGNAQGKGIELVNNIPDKNIIVADSNMFNTIVRNLISNAIKFCEAGDKISVNYSELYDEHEFTVVDTGIGISEEDKKKLFRIDVHHSEIGTRKEKGTGLGLILCAEFVNLHGGKITVESELGVGSKFKFTIKKNIKIVQ